MSDDPKVTLFRKHGNQYVYVHKDRLRLGQTVEGFIHRMTDAGMLDADTQVAVVLDDRKILFAYVKPISMHTVEMAPYSMR